MKDRTLKITEDFFSAHAELALLKEDILKAAEILLCSAKKGKILACGNGGSAADCEHISGELLKGFTLKREADSGLKASLVKKFGKEGEYIADNLEGGVKCIPLPSLTSAITAYSNDKRADLSYAQLVNALGDKGDALIAISTSGNAQNVYYAALAAKAKGIKVVALTGENGGKLKNAADACIVAPCDITYKTQETHLPVYHFICRYIESEIFDF